MNNNNKGNNKNEQKKRTTKQADQANKKGTVQTEIQGIYTDQKMNRMVKVLERAKNWKNEPE